MCYESRKQYPPFTHYRLYALGSCRGKRVGARWGVVVALPDSAIRGIVGGWSREPVLVQQLYEPKKCFMTYTSNTLPKT